jgi:putative salt-induced outer membrane protein
MRKATVLTIIIIGALCPCAFADQIIMTNGDRLTGAIVKLDDASLTIKSEFAGEVKIQWRSIETISSDQPLHVTLKDDQVIIGTLTTTEGKIEIQTREAGKVMVSKEAILLIRSEKEHAAYIAELERLRNPGLGDLWSGSLDAGLSATRGNADTLTVGVGAQAARITSRDKISVYFASLFAKNDTTGESVTTANALRGGTRYDFNLSDDLFAFGLTDLEYDKFQNLDLRFVLAGGLGFHAKKTERTRLDLFGGGAFNQEYYSTEPTRRSGEVLLGEEFAYKLSNITSLTERLVAFPSLSEGGEFRVAFDTTAVTRLSRLLSWQVTLSDRYISNPIPGVKKNDLLLTTGIRLTFGRGL